MTRLTQKQVAARAEKALGAVTRVNRDLAAVEADLVLRRKLLEEQRAALAKIDQALAKLDGTLKAWDTDLEERTAQ